MFPQLRRELGAKILRFEHGTELDLNAPVVMCDRAAWRLFGLSLAGYNALISFALAGAAAPAKPPRGWC